MVNWDIKVNEGRHLLRHLKLHTSLTVDLAYWSDLYEPTTAKLNLLIKELPTIGPTRINQTLMQYLKKARSVDLKLDDIYLVEQDDPVVRALQPLLGLTKLQDTHVSGLPSIGSPSSYFVYAQRVRV